MTTKTAFNFEDCEPTPTPEERIDKLTAEVERLQTELSAQDAKARQDVEEAQRRAKRLEGALRIYANPPLTNDRREAWPSKYAKDALGEASQDGPEPGHTIVEGPCPCCGASLDVMYGEDEGMVTIDGVPSAGGMVRSVKFPGKVRV